MLSADLYLCIFDDYRFSLVFHVEMYDTKRPFDIVFNYRREDSSGGHLKEIEDFI